MVEGRQRDVYLVNEVRDGSTAWTWPRMPGLCKR
ncbi:hypothetical protein FrEUN1fDRAFT_3862 [Parafrankia sp. EUN1f]|nr:hypothetical protein FrEUN1fDRAFT_3862 [Parafrankia sp. EUN1f]